jgi:MoxR-like ATPase
MKIFSTAFKSSSGTIRGTNFNHEDESFVYKSPLNTYNWQGKGARAVLARPIAEAIVALFDDTILGVGTTDDGRLYIECTPVGDRNKTYQILYLPEPNPIIQIFSQDVNIDTNVASRHMFIPILCWDIIQKSNQDLVLFIEGLREVYKRNGLPFDKNDSATEKYFFLANDYFYFEHKGTDYTIVVDPIVGIKLQEDLTQKVLQRDSDFRIIAKPKKKQQPKSQANTTVSFVKVSVPAIDFGEPLPKEMLDKIPNYPDWMQVPKKLIPIEKSLAAGRAISFLQHGRTGGGKSTNCKLICRDIRLPLIAHINCTNNLDEYVLGKFIPQEDKFVFFRSEVTEAVEWGGAVIFEEINFGNPKHMAFLNSLLDDNGFIRLDTGEVIKRHPCFRFFATMNYGYEGTNSLNKALYNRFNAKARIDDLADEQIINLLLNESSVTRKVAEDMLVVYRKIQAKIENEEREQVVSPRDVLNWAKQTEDSDPLTAAEFTICAIAEDDKRFEEEIYDIVKMKFK